MAEAFLETERVDGLSTEGVVGVVATQCGAIGDIALEADSQTFVVTHPGADAVSLIDRETLAVGQVPVAGTPSFVAVADARAFVVTSTLDVDSVTVIDTESGTVIAEHPLAFTVTAIAVSPDGKRAFAGRCTPDRVDVAVIDVPAERVGTVDIARGADVSIDALRVDPTGRYLYVAASDSRGSQLVVVNAETARVATTVRIGAPIRDLAHGPDGTVYVLTSDLITRGEVHVVDLAARRVTGTVEVGTLPTQLALTPDGTRAYIADYDHVAVLCTLTNKIVDRIVGTGRPAGITLSADGERLYAADYDGRVTVFAAAYTKPLSVARPSVTQRLIAATAVREREPITA